MKEIAFNKLPWLNGVPNNDDALLVDLFELNQNKGLAFNLKDLYFEAHVVEPYSDDLTIDYTVYSLGEDNKLHELDGGQEERDSHSFKLLGIILLYVRLSDIKMVTKYISHLDSKDITFFDWDDFVNCIDCK